MEDFNGSGPSSWDWCTRETRCSKFRAGAILKSCCFHVRCHSRPGRLRDKLLKSKLTPEVANQLILRRERVQRECLDTYKAKRRNFHICRAAAKLWAAGIPWERAHSIVREAFVAATHEA